MADLNLKNADAHRLARELAAITGESMTQAVITSVRERLERLRSTQDGDIEAQVERILELAKVIHDAAPPGYWDQDFDDVLYDEHGVPR